jgi:hypothetical protein
MAGPRKRGTDHPRDPQAPSPAEIPMRPIILLLLLALGGSLTAAEIPPDHPQLPDFSWAGYRCGEKPLPELPVTHAVADFGAVPNDESDDTEAINRTILACEQAGGGVVGFVAGTYKVSGILRVHRSGVVLKGAGAGKTILFCSKSLSDLNRPLECWNWCGGIVWVDPSPIRITAEFPPLSAVAPAKRGDRELAVEPGGGRYLAAAVGRPMCLVWIAGDDLVRHILGDHTSLNGFDLKAVWGRLAKGWIEYTWIVEIAGVEGDRVRLAQPLRLDHRKGWDLRITPVWFPTEEVGVEGLTLRFPAHEQEGHLKDPGFNGVFFKDVRHGWIRNLAIEGADNGIILEGSSHVTLRDLVLGGDGRFHHATSFRSGSHDNLMQDFRIEARTQHGISAQDMASGLKRVWPAEPNAASGRP